MGFAKCMDVTFISSYAYVTNRNPDDGSTYVLRCLIHEPNGELTDCTVTSTAIDNIKGLAIMPY